MTTERLPLLHLAFPDDWMRALDVGEYTWSTRGVSIAEQGFMHCSRGADQAVGVVARFYADVADDLVVLSLDEDALVADGFRVVDEHAVPGDASSELFPHLYGGPLPVRRVSRVAPWHRVVAG